MSRTINTTINGPLFLLPTDNPLTITASGGVNATATDAIDGDSSTAWAISNAGKIQSASGNGMFLLAGSAGSSVTNNPGGSISGTGPNRTRLAVPATVRSTYDCPPQAFN